jgi:putative transcriptional regulator
MSSKIKKKNRVSEEIRQGLKEIIAHQSGKITLKTRAVEVPDAPTEYKAREIKEIRETNNYSQGLFAQVLNVSVKTVQSWESGQRVPAHSALRLLQMVDRSGIKRVLEVIDATQSSSAHGRRR